MKKIYHTDEEQSQANRDKQLKYRQGKVKLPVYLTEEMMERWKALKEDKGLTHVGLIEYLLDKEGY